MMIVGSFLEAASLLLAASAFVVGVGVGYFVGAARVSALMVMAARADPERLVRTLRGEK